MKHFFIFFLLFNAVSFSYAQPLSSSSIDSLVQRSMKAFDVPGIAVAVLKDGKVVHSRGYGIRSLNTREKVDENTLFGIASNTKAFTSAALGMLADEGKLNWGDKVRKFIPEFKLYDPYVTEEFTIRDLLTHRSGMGLGAGDLMFFPDSSDFTIKDVIYNLRFLKPVSSFRSKYDYDNNLYIIAGEIVARVSGMSWEQFIELRILNPLGMSNSASSYARLKNKMNVIDGHAPVDGKVSVIARNSSQIMLAAGGIYSSIADLGKWVQTHLSHGKYDGGKRLFSEDVQEEMWAPQTIIPIRGTNSYNTHFASYGLGFGISDVKGYKQLSHTGGLEGMVTQITMIPELALGIIVLTNQQEGGAFVSITNQIKDGYLGVHGIDRVDLASKSRKEQLAEAKKLTDSIWSQIAAVQKANAAKPDIATYLGTFRDPWLGEVTVSLKNGKPWFDSKRSPKLTGEMIPYKANTFIVKWRDRSMDADAFINFILDENGKASGFNMKAVSPLTDFSYDFHDLDFKRL